MDQQVPSTTTNSKVVEQHAYKTDKSTTQKSVPHPLSITATENSVKRESPLSRNADGKSSLHKQVQSKLFPEVIFSASNSSAKNDESFKMTKDKDGVSVWVN